MEEESLEETTCGVKTPYPGMPLTMYLGACVVMKKVTVAVKEVGVSTLPDLNTCKLSRDLTEDVRE